MVGRASFPEPVPEEFASALSAAGDRLGPLAGRVMFFSTVGSTNDVAARLADAPDAEGTVVIADAQSAGRGRRGRSWFSPPGAGLYVSVVLTPGHTRHAGDRATPLLTIAAGVALAEGIQRATGLQAAIKWPNDLLAGRRKIAGILAEGLTTSAAGGRLSAVVLGYGINVRPVAYPADLGDRVTALESELGRPIDRAALCAETLASLAARYADLLGGRFDAILDAWRERAPGGRGERVSWDTPEGPRSGITAGIDDRGALLVQVGDRTERLVAGEVTWVS